MKSSYEIKREMKDKFGVEFIEKMESQKSEYERLQEELKEAESFEEKVNNMRNELRKTFIYISDDYTIYPDETCNNYLYQFAKQCVEENASKERIEELHTEYEFKVIEGLEDDIKLLQEAIKNIKAQWDEK